MARLIESYNRTKEYGDLSDSPLERLRELLLNLFSSRELPNIILGGAIAATVSAAFGNTSASVAAAGWVIYVVSVVNYILATEVIAAARAAREEFRDDEPRGIE